MKTGRLFFCFALLSAALTASADSIASLDYQASVIANASTGDFAPYMLGSWNYGKVTEKSGIWNNGYIGKRLDRSSRFSWSAGFEYMFGYGSAADYDDYRKMTDGKPSKRAVRQAPARIQQLFGELKYRGVYLLAGMKERHSQIVDDRLSSGDLVRSNNARPIPGVAAGFIDFQDIPFTNGWLQIDGEIMYGRFCDTRFEENRFNYYSGFLDGDLMYTYKRCYFRTKPSQPLSVTVGMQTAAEFGGYTHLYRGGVLVEAMDRGFHFRDLFDMFLPLEGNGEDFYKGNSLGSWDFKARYALSGGSKISAYFQWPFEDGSGIGRQNGWDGLWGLQYDFAPGSPVSSLVFEYLDFTNQSGPIHWATSDNPGTDLKHEITGGDNYYNNNYYGAYANYGMSIGTPFLMSPLYNLNGFLEYMHNRARGFHAAVAGSFGRLGYRAMVSYQKAGGMGRIPAPKKLHDTSAMLEAVWNPAPRIPGLQLKAAAAFDAGNLRGNNFGALLSVSYSGSFKFRKK